MMFKHATKQLTPLLFAGILAIGTSFAMAQTSTPQNPSASAPGASTSKQQIKRDRQKLRADKKQYGKKSSQAKADRKQLRLDRSNQPAG